MTTTFKPFGLSQVGYLLAAKPRNGTYDFPIQSGTGGSFGSGEPVALNEGYAITASAGNGYPPVTPNSVLLGVFQSVKYRPSQSNTPPATFPTWIAGTTTFNADPGSMSVIVDPYVIYNVQCNAQLTLTAVGNVAQLGGFNNLDSNGNSQVYLNSSTIATGNTQSVRIIGLAPVTPAMQVQGNNSWDDTYPIVQVVMNNTLFRYGTYGV